MTTIICRARLVDACQHGRDPIRGLSVKDDGTYDPEDQTIVCDECYSAIMPFTRSGQALLDEIPAAVAHYREQLTIARQHPNPDTLRMEAEHAAEYARCNGAGTIAVDSAKLCAAIARREIARRESSDDDHPPGCKCQRVCGGDQ